MTTRAALAQSLHFAVGELSDRPATGDGPLSGRRLIVKDLFDVAGEPTFAGCDTAIEPSAAATAPAVQRLLGAGAVYVGKAQMVQLAFGGWGTNACVGAPRNPWDAEAYRVAGGSSSGSAVAVAAGFADLALGSDTGGSIRIPGSLCGVVGLKPSQGKVSVEGVVPLSPSLDSVGPMAGTVADVGAAFGILTGDAPVTGPGSLETVAFRALAPGDLVAETDVATAYSAAIRVLIEAGAQVEAMALPTAPGDYVHPTGRVMGHEAWHLHGDRIERGRATADPGVLHRFRAVAGIDAREYRAAQARRTVDRRTFADWFDGARFLVTPTTARTAPRIEDVDEGDFTLAHYTRMANYLDLCAVTLPCGFDRAGLPIGLQLIARAGDETILIATAWAIEEALALPARLPPLHASRTSD